MKDLESKLNRRFFIALCLNIIAIAFSVFAIIYKLTR